MGVHGLWKLLEAAGKPVPLETLENKVLAVDVSIWLHQMMKGFQDSRGAPVPNAHLLGLFHRVCKLLFYRIKPVFVFDGGVPLLKKQTIAARKNQKKRASQNAAEARDKLLKNLVKRKAVRQLLQGPKASSDIVSDSSIKDDLFNLPPLPEDGTNSDSEEESQDQLFMESSESDSDSKVDVKPSSQQLLGAKFDLHSLDVNSEEFLSLPPDVRHDILSELKETRKQNSWGRIHEMPEESGDFSTYQLGRLLKRRSVQVSLEKAEKEMGGKVLRMNELQELMEAQGVSIIEEHALMDSASRRIASDSATRYVLCKDSVNLSQVSESSQATDNFEEEKNDTLLNDQMEFIAKMAENMMQKLTSENKGKLMPNVSKEALVNVKEIAADLISEIEKPVLDNIKMRSRENFLSDCWSSDEDVSADCGSSLKSKEVSNQHENSSSPTQQVSPKRKNNDCPTHSASKIPKRVSSNEDNFDGIISPSSQPHSECSSVEGSAVKFKDESKVLHCNDYTVDSLTSSTENITDNAVSHVVKTSDNHSIKKKGSAYIANNKPAEKAERSENMFVDIPERQPVHTQDIRQDSQIGTQKSVEIVVSSLAKPGDDLFADIFSCESLEKRAPGIIDNCRPAGGPLEIMIRPGVEPENDIFADIFTLDQPRDQLKTFKEEAVSDAESDATEVLSLKDDLQWNVKVENTFDQLASKDFKEVTEKITDHLGNDRREHKPISDNDSSAGIDVSTMESGSSVTSIFPDILVSNSSLNQIEASLEAEQLGLQKERGRQERLAASITDQMCIEAQELLQLFGLPYVVAPMEAEAQCAFLDEISLTEGSITDDSDIWLFGGKKVYKNFFNQKKHVLQFTSSSISHYFKLSREQLVQLALLVGSDYTSGIQGVGPVTALEIVSAFHGNADSDPVQQTLKGLGLFRDWWNAGRPHKSNRLRLLDKKLKNVHFSEGFPSKSVVEAYLHPSVENSQETFSWGALDLPALREYARSKFGWPVSKTDEILLPVQKRWTARNSQRTIDSYFNFQPHLVQGLNKMSKRVQKAVTLMEVDNSSDVDDPDPIPESSGVEGKTRGEKRLVRSKEKNIRKKQCKIASDSESSNEGHKISSTMVEGKTKQLPVRAPTIPRERTSTGVRRVGKKPTTILNDLKITENSKSSQLRCRNEEISFPSSESIQEPLQDTEPRFEDQDINQKIRGKKFTNVQRQSPVMTPKPPPQTSSVGVTRVKIKSTSESKFSSSADNSSYPKSIQMSPSKSSEEETAKSCPKAVHKLSSNKYLNEYVNEHELGVKEIVKAKKSISTAITKFNIEDKEVTNLPSCSHTSEQMEDSQHSEDLAVLSEMNWDDDPWGKQEAGPSFEVDRRPKLFFGGIRANRPKKPTKIVPAVPAEARDERGVRPGWVTRERLESRAVWVDSMHRKKELAIPQRQQDQRAFEVAKMKAISVVKAAEVRQASRLLGRNPARRGKGKKRLTGKILPEHNLSESSSDE